MTETLVDMGTVRLVVTTRDDPKRFWTPMEFGDAFYCISSLVLVGSALHTVHRFAEEGFPVPSAGKLSRDMSFAARLSAAQFRVRRISYNSPLEVLLYASTGSSLAYLIATRIVSLWEKVSDARIKHSQANVAASQADLKIEANNIILSDWSAGVSLTEVKEEQYGLTLLDAHIKQAAQALIAAHRIEILDSEDT